MTTLAAFEAAARHLSFTRAAEELNLTQAAVSRQIRILEESLGLSLFTRSHRAIQLTANGKKFHSAVTTSLELLSSATQELQSIPSNPAISIASDLLITSSWLLPRISKFRVAHPDITIRVVASDENTDRLNDDIDIAIQYGSGNWEGCNSTFLFGEEVFPVCTPEYLETIPSVNNVQDLLSATLLHPEDGHWDWMDWQSWLAHNYVNLSTDRQDIYINNYQLLIQAALSNQGIALGWRHLIDDLLKNGNLIRPVEVSVSTQSGVYLLSPNSKTPTVEATIFREWIIKNIG